VRSNTLQLHATPQQANRMLRTLSLMYNLARDWGLLPAGVQPAGHSPCTGVMKYPERKRERFLTDAEFERLGDVLREAEERGGASLSSIAAIRLLLLTGCRKSEILTLRWEHVDLDAAQRTGLALENRHVMPRVVDHLVALKLRGCSPTRPLPFRFDLPTSNANRLSRRNSS